MTVDEILLRFKRWRSTQGEPPWTLDELIEGFEEEMFPEVKDEAEMDHILSVIFADEIWSRMTACFASKASGQEFTIEEAVSEILTGIDEDEARELAYQIAVDLRLPGQRLKKP